MAVTTRAVLRENLAKATGFYYSGTNTGTANNTVVDTGIQRYDTVTLVNLWVLMTSGNNAGNARRISSVSGSTATVTTAWANANANGDTFEILPYDPDILHDALEEACRKVYPDLHQLATEYVVVDNLLANPSFEEAESTGSITAFADYDGTVEGTTLVTDAGHGLSTGDVITISGTTNYNGTFEITRVSSSTFWIRAPFVTDDATGTWVEARFNQEGTATGWTATAQTWTFPTQLRRVHGQRAARCAASGAAGRLTQNLFLPVNVRDLVGKTLHVRGWIFATAASAGRFRVSLDGGTTFSNGSYHDGDDEWQYMDDLNVTITANATSITVYCEVTDGQTCFFDLVTAWIDQVANYPTVKSYATGPSTVEQQEYQYKPDGLYLPLGRQNAPISGRLLKIRGATYISVPTGDNQVVEVSERRADIIVAEAAAIAYRRLVNTAEDNQDSHRANAQTWAAEAAALRNRPGLRMKLPPAQLQDGWSWRDGVLTLER